MKKLFTLIAAALLTLSANAAFDYTFNWGVVVEGTAAQSSYPINLLKASDGNYIALTNWGTTEALGLNVIWGGETLQNGKNEDIEGFAYNSGNSYNANILLSKVDAKTGKTLWNAYTSVGDVSASIEYSAVKELSDGGFIVLLSLRPSNLEASRHLATFVDAAGEEYFFEHSNPDYVSVRELLIKLDKDGKFVWSRTINGLDETTEGKSVNIPLYVKDLIVDADDNIYIAGQLRTEIYPVGAAGKQSVLTHSLETANWDGTIQTSSGNAIVLKFDSNGKFVKSVDIAADATKYAYSYADNFVLNDGKIYLVGHYQPADKSVTVNAFFTTLTTDLAVSDIHTYTVAVNAGNRQNLLLNSLAYIDGALYLSANLVGSISEGNVSVSATGSAASQSAALLKLDTDGTLLAGLASADVNTGWRGVVEYDGKLIGLTYKMSNGGTLIYELDKALSTLPTPTIIIASGMSATAAAPIIDGDKLVVYTRGNKSASAYYGTTDVKPTITKNFSSILGSWKITEKSTAAKVAVADNESANAKKYSVAGIELNENSNEAVYIQNGTKYIK